MVVEPRHPEHEDALGFRDALENPLRDIFWVSLQHKTQRLEHFLDGLVELGLGRVLGLYQHHYVGDVIARGLNAGRRHYSYCHKSSSSNLTAFHIGTAEAGPFQNTFVGRVSRHTSSLSLLGAQSIEVLNWHSRRDRYHPVR